MEYEPKMGWWELTLAVLLPALCEDNEASNDWRNSVAGKSR
jgi:hypothetical protein